MTLAVRDRRALLVGGGVIVLAFLGLRAVPAAWQSWRESSGRLDARRLYLERAEAELAALPALEDSTRALTTRVVGLAPALVSGESGTAAVAGLSGHLSHVALANRVRLDRADPVPDSVQAGDLHRVTMDAVFESDVRGLAGLLGALATGQPVTEVTSLRVSANDPLAPSSGPEVLRIELRVRAWYLARGTT